MLPLKSTEGWDRNIKQEEASTLFIGQPDDPYSGNYMITFWPPTRNNSSALANASDAEQPPGVITVRRC